MQRKVVFTDPRTGRLTEAYVDRGRGGSSDPRTKPLLTLLSGHKAPTTSERGR